MTIRKLMVPTDFSSCADRAAELAIRMAKRFDAEVLFLHLFPDPVGSLHVPRNFEMNMTTPDIANVKAGLDRLV
ncbi:MAG TPA: universal stress protein, partial [Ohtaekwangia sp.]|nr:universal stress protein [Ohtaekwangia sp.]